MRVSRTQSWTSLQKVASQAVQKWEWKERGGAAKRRWILGMRTETQQDCEAMTNNWKIRDKRITLIRRYILVIITYVVTLNILSRRSALKTDNPNDPALGLKYVHITSKTLPLITRQSNLEQEKLINI